MKQPHQTSELQIATTSYPTVSFRSCPTVSFRWRRARPGENAVWLSPTTGLVLEQLYVGPDGNEWVPVPMLDEGEGE